MLIVLTFALFLPAALLLYLLIVGPDDFDALGVETQGQAICSMVDAFNNMYRVAGLMELSYGSITYSPGDYQRRVNFVDKHIFRSKRVSSMWFRVQRRLTQIWSKL